MVTATYRSGFSRDRAACRTTWEWRLKPLLRSPGWALCVVRCILFPMATDLSKTAAGVADTAVDIGDAEYLRRINAARVYEVAVETPLTPALQISKRLNNQVFLKREDLQPVYSFKLRGAYNKIAHLSPEQRAQGVICASAGNHAQGVALSGRRRR
jgi:hypothetical protein